VTDESLEPVTFGDSSGIIAYETPGNEANGTIYTAVIQPAGYESVQLFDGHYAGLNGITPGSSYTSYVGGGWSKAGFDSFEEWVSFLKAEKEKFDQPLTIDIQ